MKKHLLYTLMILFFVLLGTQASAKAVKVSGLKIRDVPQETVEYLEKNEGQKVEIEGTLYGSRYLNIDSSHPVFVMHKTIILCDSSGAKYELWKRWDDKRVRVVGIFHESRRDVSWGGPLIEPVFSVRIVPQNLKELWGEMERELSRADLKEIAGKLTCVPAIPSFASRPYENFRLGTSYVFPDVSDLQQKYFDREVSLAESCSMIYATKPNVSGPKEYKTPQHYKYAKEYEKRIKSFEGSMGKHIIAIGKNRKDGEYTYFEISATKPLAPIYKLEIPEKEKMEFNCIWIPARKDVNFVLEVTNPFEQPIEHLVFCISPDYPKLFEFNDPNVKEITLLKPGETRRLVWNFKIKEPWWQNVKLLVYAPGKPIIASYEYLEIVGTIPRETQGIMKQIDPVKYERQARKAVLENPPPEEFIGFFNREVLNMLQKKDYSPASFSPIMWPSLTFAWKTSSIGSGPVEVLLSSEGEPLEIIYNYYKPDFSLVAEEDIDTQEEVEIVKKLSFISKEKAIQKSKEAKGGSGNFIYDYASASLVKIPKKPYYLWKVTYHIKKEASVASYNYHYDYINPETGDLIWGLVVVKPKN